MRGTGRVKCVGLWLLWVVLIVGCITISFTGCTPFNTSSKVPRIKGDKLHLPDGFYLAISAKACGGKPPVYTLFDQEYPPEWPVGLVFPDGTYVYSTPIELTQIDHKGWATDGYLVFKNNFVIPLENEDTVDYLVEQAENADYATEIVDLSPNPYNGTDMGNVISIRRIQIKLSNSQQSDSGYFLVLYDENMENYTHVSCELYDTRMTVAR